MSSIGYGIEPVDSYGGEIQYGGDAGKVKNDLLRFVIDPSVPA